MKRVAIDVTDREIHLLRQMGFRVGDVEDIPEPNRVQEFRVRVETRPTENPWTAAQLRLRMPFFDVTEITE